MATLKQKIAAEQKVRELLECSDVPFPDEIEYGHACIRLFWLKPKVVLVVDIDEQRDDVAGEGGNGMAEQLGALWWDGSSTELDAQRWDGSSAGLDSQSCGHLAGHATGKEFDALNVLTWDQEPDDALNILKWDQEPEEDDDQAKEEGAA